MFSVWHTQLQEFSVSLCRLTSRDELTNLVTDCMCHMTHSDDPVLQGVCSKLNHFIHRLDHLEGECVCCACVCVCVCVCANASNSYLVLYLMSDVLTLPCILYIAIFRGASWGDTWSKSGGRGPQAAENRFEKSTKGQWHFFKWAAVCSFVPDVTCSRRAILLSSFINFGIYFIYFKMEHHL